MAKSNSEGDIIMKLIDTPEEFETWCLKHDVTKDELAELFGVTRQTLYNWTHPKRSVVSEKVKSEDVRADISQNEAQYAKLPRMLSLSLYALDMMDASPLFDGIRVRKRSRRR
jgi:hypothetical protein